MQRLDVGDCRAEPYLITVLVKVKKILIKLLTHACAEAQCKL